MRFRFLILAAIALFAGVGFLQGRPRAAREGDTITVPFRMLPSNHMVVDAKLNGKGPYRFIFDLGAPVTLLTNKAAEDSDTVEKGKARSFLMGVRGEASVKRLRMGELEAKDVPVIVMDHPLLNALGGLFSKPLSGIIGYTFWARYKMTIDYKARELTFTPVDFEVKDLFKDLPARLQGNTRAPKTIVLAPKGLWGFALASPSDPANGQGVPIKSVVPGSPADQAGLRAGDVLTSLDGRWTTNVNDTYAAAEKVPPGRAADVVVLRDGKELTLTVKPAEGL